VLRETGLVAILRGTSSVDLGEIADLARSGARTRVRSPMSPRAAAEVAVPVLPST
jgi:hypothetical protein